MRQACTMRSCQRFRLDEVQRDTSSTLLSFEFSITGPAVLAGIAAPLVAASRALGCSKVCGLYAARAALVRNVSLYFVFIATNCCMTLRFSMALLSLRKADTFWAAAVARGARWIPPAATANHEAAATRRRGAHWQQFNPHRACWWRGACTRCRRRWRRPSARWLARASRR